MEIDALVAFVVGPSSVLECGLVEPAGERLLDLDVPPDGGAGQGDVKSRLRQRRFGSLPVAVAVLLGMVAAAAGTHIFENRQREARDASQVSLTALVAGAGSSGAGDNHTLTIEGSIAVANSGPVPVIVEEVKGSVGGLTFRSRAAATVRPGVAQIPVTVTVTVDCWKGVPAEPVEAVMNVRTADGQAHVASSLMIVNGTPWATSHEQMCAAATAVILDPSTGAVIG